MDNKHRIVLASSNKGKIEELTALLQPFNIEIIPQSAFNITDADETGLTFIENALIKARHAASLSGLPALADDSGLSVDALNGAPGIYSARYGGTKLSYKEKMIKLCEEMDDVPDGKRGASFHCVLALINTEDDPIPLICHGTMRGSILSAPRGQHGFGYDPIFFVTSENQAAAELPPEIKNKISHRALALQQLVSQLSDKL